MTARRACISGSLRLKSSARAQGDKEILVVLRLAFAQLHLFVYETQDRTLHVSFVEPYCFVPQPLELEEVATHPLVSGALDPGE